MPIVDLSFFAEFLLKGQGYTKSPSCTIASKIKYVIELATLRTARAIHVRVVGINKCAVFTTKNIVLTGGRLKTFPPEFVVNTDRTQRCQQCHHIPEDQRLVRHCHFSAGPSAPLAAPTALAPIERSTNPHHTGDPCPGR